eukprot:scaffold62527_cov49-Attheya_sp.AAC.2
MPSDVVPFARSLPVMGSPARRSNHNATASHIQGEDDGTDSTVASSVPPPPSPVDATDSQPPKNQPPPLPLGWTQVRRGGTRKRKLAGIGQTVVDFCCDDPASCDNQGSMNHGNAATENSAARNSGDAAENIQPKGGKPTVDAKDDESSSSRLVVVEGQAVFCLHSLDATWFQGQFLPNSTQKNIKRPMGILAVNREDMDDCLKCADGGYREMDVTIYNNRSPQKKKLLLQQVSCTGGDMLSLSSNTNDGRPKQQTNHCRVSFDADSVKTGVRAVPFVKLYFPTLLQTAANPSSRRMDESSDCSSNTTDDSSVLELLPDVAIVIGTMRLTVPRKFMGDVPSNDDSPRTSNQPTDDSDWLSDG